ncbi:MAG: hypothetical protein V1854_00605 [Methanobacteriota archaeon]
MFIRTQCTQCGNADYHNVKLHALEHTVFDDLIQACRYTVENIEVADTISEEAMATLIMCELRGQVKNGIEISDLCKIIKEYFGVAANYCCDIVQRIKLEAGMYSPDKVHLYYAQ